MFWMLGLTALSMIGGSRTASAQAAGSIAVMEGEKKVRRYNQMEANDKQRVAQHMQNLQNDRILKAGAKQHTAATSNLLRTQDAAARQGIEAQIAQSEAAGAYAANVASKGVGGASVAMIDHAMALRNERAQAARDLTNGQVNYDMAQQLAGTMSQAVQGTDTGVRSMGQDNSVMTRQVSRGYDWAGALVNSGLAGLADKATASWLGTGSGSGNAGGGLSLGGSGLGFTNSGATGFWASPTLSSRLGL